MNKEQKDWFEYGGERSVYRMLKRANSPLYRLMIQSVWDARKKAHAWKHKGDCERCKHSYTLSCKNCLYNTSEYHTYLDNWEPKTGQ